MVAWNEDIYSKQDDWTRRFEVAVKLMRKSDDFEWVVTFI